MVGQEKKEKYTKRSNVILASASEVRKKILKQYFSKVISVPHTADEDKYKTQKKKPAEIVLRIAKEKALSILKN